MKSKSSPCPVSHERKPLQMVTTFGSYATAPMSNVIVVPSHQRHAEGGPADELVQRLGRRCHHPGRQRVAEQAFDAHLLTERRSAAQTHDAVRERRGVLR